MNEEAAFAKLGVSSSFLLSACIWLGGDCPADNLRKLKRLPPNPFPPRAAFAALASPADPLDGLPGGDDLDPLEAPQRKQIIVAADDQISMSGQGTGEHRIIIGIA